MNTIEIDLFRYRETVKVLAKLSYKKIVKGKKFAICRNYNGYAIFHNQLGKIAQHTKALNGASYFIELEKFS